MNRQLIYPEECYAIRGAIYEVYREMGSGFREEVYQQCLERELSARGIPFDAKKELRIFYKGAPIEKTYIPDLVLLREDHCRDQGGGVIDQGTQGTDDELPTPDWQQAWLARQFWRVSESDG